MSKARSTPATAGAKLLQKRKQGRAKVQRAKKQVDKLAGMCDAARAMHDAREAVKTAAKEKKSAEGLATLRAAQIAYSKQLDAARKAQEERRSKERAAAAAEVRADEAARADEPSPKARPKPPSAKSVTFAPGTTPSDGQRREARSAVVPTVFELQQSKRYACASVSLPDTASLATMAAASVVCADAIGGIGAWGDGAGTWAAPHRWIPLVEKLNRAYNLAPDREDGSSTRHVLGMKLRNGEYNMVFFPERDVEPEIDLPPLVDGSGRVLAPHEVVFRVTRPDASVQHNGDPFYRYKPFKAIQREFYYTLHGAAHDYAPPCLAAILYPAVLIVNKDGSTETLYGALYVLHRASKDLVSLLDDETTRLREAHAGRTQLPAYAGALRKAGSKAALWLLPVLVRQAKLGALSFDAKPANYVFGADGKPYAIDFDAGMYSVSNDARVQWHAGLLMLVGLLTAHVRLYSAPALADGWAGALRPLVLELCAGARGARWLFDARVVNREFSEIMSDTDEAARRRLEMMTHVYFTNAKRYEGAPFRPASGANAPGLTEQLLRYSLHGTTTKADEQLAAALGCAKARSALAAAAVAARPWG